jgi:hypothetical protein
MPCVDSGKRGRPSESTAGSGKFGTPWERMQLEKGSMLRRRSGTSDWGNWSSTPTGSSRWQTVSAVLSWELLTRSCCALGNFALLAPAWGSGKFATPCERTQREKATSGAFADPPAFAEFADSLPVGEPPEPVEDGLPLHAPTRASAQMPTMAAAARRCRPMRRPVWLNSPGT